MHFGKEGRKEGKVAQRFVGAVIAAHLASATVAQSWSREVAVVSGGSVDDLSTDPAVNVTTKPSLSPRSKSATDRSIASSATPCPSESRCRRAC